MRNLKFPALFAAFLLSLATVSPAVAAPPTNTNIQVGTSSTSGVPNINVEVSTTSSTVSLTIQIAGSTAAPGGTSAGSYQIAGGIKVVKSPGAKTAGVFHRDPTSADPAAVNTETGFTSVGGGSFTGTFNAGNVTSNPLTYAQSALGGGSGEVAACIPLVYYFASNSSENIWYCTQTFNWPVSAGGGNPPCQVNGNPATLTDVGVSRSTLSPGETYRTTIGGQPLASACSISISSGYWVRTSINSTVVTVSGTIFTTSILYTNTSAISYEALLTGLGNQGYNTPIQPGDVWKREVFTTSNPPTLSDTPVTTMTMTLGVSTVSSPSAPAPRSVYSGPEILAIDTFRPIVAGGKLTFTGKNLSAVTSATIGAKAASLSFDATSGLSIGTPSGLEPGKYDLVMESSYGKLTHINAVTIKAPTPTVTIGFRSDDAYLDEKQVLDLVAFNQTLNSDYEKVRCIVNASDPKVAKRIADLVCAQVARGEARNVEVIKDIRNTYPGVGFWVRVYAAG